VRDDASASALRVQLPVTTCHACNAWGGKSPYHWGSSGGQRASKVSFNRPYAANAQNPAAALADASKHGVAHMSLYTAAGGAVVFATGSMQWAWGLDDFNAPALRSSRRSPAAQQITRNVLRRFAVT
jgi:hypothetical protein